MKKSITNYTNQITTAIGSGLSMQDSQHINQGNFSSTGILHVRESSCTSLEMKLENNKEMKMETVNQGRLLSDLKQERRHNIIRDIVDCVSVPVKQLVKPSRSCHAYKSYLSIRVMKLQALDTELCVVVCSLFIIFIWSIVMPCSTQG